MYAAGNIASLASGVTGTTVDISMYLFSGVSDSSVFEIDTATDEFKILVSGVYLATISVGMAIGAAPAADAYASVGFNLTDDHGSGLLEGDIQPWANLTQIGLGGSIPLNVTSTTFASIQVNQTSGQTAGVNIELLVFQVNPTAITLS